MSRRTPLTLALVVAACARGEPAAPPDPRAETLARLDRMTTRCGAPAGTLRLIGTDHVRVQPASNVDYEKFACLLKAVEKADPKLSFGFVGSEAETTEAGK